MSTRRKSRSATLALYLQLAIMGLILCFVVIFLLIVMLVRKEKIKYKASEKYNSEWAFINNTTDVSTSNYDMPDDGILIDMVGLDQDAFPTGCEMVSTTALLNHLGVPVSVDEMMQLLPKEDFYYIGGVLYGANPEEKFPGSPYDAYGLGCYPPVVIESLDLLSSLPEYNNYHIQGEDISGYTLAEICDKYLLNGIPVLVWVTSNMKPPTPGTSYMLSDGTIYTWMSGEHCMVLCGFDDKYYYFKDPLSDGNTVCHEKQRVEECYVALGQRAVTISVSN